jgi:hypothetical protein
LLVVAGVVVGTVLVQLTLGVVVAVVEQVLPISVD